MNVVAMIEECVIERLVLHCTRSRNIEKLSRLFSPLPEYLNLSHH